MDKVKRQYRVTKDLRKTNSTRRMGQERQSTHSTGKGAMKEEEVLWTEMCLPQTQVQP